MALRPESGWPFWWRFVLATNAGWFPGIYLGLEVAGRLPDASPLLRAVVAAAFASALFGAGQAFVLRGLLPRPWHWGSATLLGWTAGVALARTLVDAASVPLSLLADAIVVAAVAGAGVGALQAFVLRLHLAGWAWWVPISCLGWAALVPGAVPGAGLVWLARSHRADRD